MQLIRRFLPRPREQERTVTACGQRTIEIPYQSTRVVSVTLGSEQVCCAAISFYEMQHVNEYLFASGKRLYGKLEKNAAVCASCSAPCLGSCPLGIDIKERTSGAHDLLTLG